MAGRIQPTDEQLQQAWAARRRADWPASFEATMGVPLLATLVRAEAVHRVIVAERLGGKPVAYHYWPQVKRNPIGAPGRSPPAIGIDRKRAAAGDRDDD